MNRKNVIRMIAVVPAVFAAALSAAEAKKTAAPAAATPAQTSAPAATTASNAPGQNANPAAASGMVTSEKIVLVRPSASLEIMAEPSKVWKKLTSHEGLSAFGITSEKKKGLDKVGDNVRATLAGDAGNLVVTHIVKEGEWRAAFEPEKGNYVCSVRFMLKPQGKNTVLTHSDWYSDEKSATVDQTLEATRKSMTESVARFKGLVEKTTAAGNP